MTLRSVLGAALGVTIVSSAIVSPARLNARQRTVEKQVVVSITTEELKGGIVAGLLWDGGVLMVQGVFAQADGQLKSEYLVMPAEGIELKRLTQPTEAALKYWTSKSNRRSPTGLGEITQSSDTKMPMYGVGSLDQRVRDAQDMGGTITRHMLRLGPLVIHERTAATAPYDGETYSWSPPELNRLAYVDAKGDLWVADADGTRSRRLLKGEFTLPAWSTDGRIIAVTERKDRGRRWDIAVVYLPDELATPPRTR